MACSNDLLDVLKLALPEDVYIVVGTANPLVNDGTAVEPGDQSFTISIHAQWKTRLQRGGFGQQLGNPGTGTTYFEYATISGEYTLSLAAQVGDEFICQAYKPA